MLKPEGFMVIFCCEACFSGSIEAAREAPYFEGSCSPVDCPENALGASVSEGLGWFFQVENAWKPSKSIEKKPRNSF